MRGIITLTTDFGMLDHYVGVMKGVILAINPTATLVDMTHGVPRQDIGHAASLLPGFPGFFPEGTVHLAVVDPRVGTPRRPLVVSALGQSFVGPDNGLFTGIYTADPGFRAFEIAEGRFMLEPVSATFHGRDIFAPAAAHLTLGVDPALMGPVARSVAMLEVSAPAREGDAIRGRVVRADAFGNLITDIAAGLLPDGTDTASMVVEVLGRGIRGLSRTYADVPAGGLLALVGSGGTLEVSVNCGSALDVLGAGDAAGAEVVIRLSVPSPKR